MKTIAVIGARLNSSRLPGKQLLALAQTPLIAHVFRRLESITNIDEIVLATTADDVNTPLVNWAHDAGKQVFAFDGDVNNLMARVDAVVKAHQADIVVYVCGDSPLIAPDAIEQLISTLKQQPDADLVRACAPNDLPCIHEGFDVFKRAFWDRMMRHSITETQREHVGSVIPQLNDVKQINVEQPAHYCQLQHRLSVDTSADYHFMSETYRRWYANNSSDSLVSLEWVVSQLLNDPALRAINQHVQQRQAHQTVHNILIITACGQDIGLGHLSRAIIIATALKEHLSYGVKLLILGEPIQKNGLELLAHEWCTSHEQVMTRSDALIATGHTAVISDLPWHKVPAQYFAWLRELSILRVAIDTADQHEQAFDLNFIPSFFLADESAADHAQLQYGWDCFLLPQQIQASTWQPGKRIGIFTGGSDPQQLGQSLPAVLDANLNEDMEVLWIKGRYAKPPCIPKATRLNWQVIDSPEGLGEIMNSIDYAVTLYGVTLFELLQKGIPSVVIPSLVSEQEIQAFAAEHLAAVARDNTSIATTLKQLINTPSTAAKFSNTAQKKIDGQGAARLAQLIQHSLAS